MYDELAEVGDGGDEQQQQQQQPGQQEDVPPGGNMDDFLADAPLPDDENPVGSKSPIQSEKDEQSMDVPTVKSPEEQMEKSNDEQSSEANSEDVENEKKKEDDESALAPTQLGNALDSLMMHWCQLLTNVTVKPPVPPPSTLDHVKEVAEVCSKHFRDASVDVNNEFTRLGLQWEMEEIANQSIIEETHLDEAIERQERLLEQARDIIRQRLEQFHKECPNAGTQFTT
ncbi:hypothetical protein L5515_009582 [Caenorhabditis briggsae]|uniref:Uncharacterized protein n=1 Tax=Caenorhabditis briggsae TaxID=6238 RepID=A0AAE9FA80_CAEBR|nr:hypothetical protein L3Y34_009771 [Caenorhabditis briggsae]UMM37989.1 hypothetical protein L5515_009582 [Caenorhabditis briggsae]